MKSSEAIVKYYDKIRETMIECYRSVIECGGRIQYKVYVWEDGEIVTLEGVQGDNSWLQPRDMEPRKLFAVDTVSVSPGFDIWDYAEDGMPDDEIERETMQEQIIDWLVESYESQIDETLDAIIEDCKFEECE